MVIFVIVLLVIVVIFGVASGMQSYASAQQAQAVIETAKAAQVSAWGNLINILALLGFIVIVMALIVAALWWLKKNKPGREVSVSNPRREQLPSATMPAFDINALIQLEMLRTLRGLNAPAQTTRLLTDEQGNEPDVMAVPAWLRR